MMKIAASIVLVCVWVLAPAPAAADTTADCGRFYLKFNPQTKRMECVGGSKRQSSNGANLQSIARRYQRELTGLRRALDNAEALLDGRQLKQDAEQRVRELLNEARNRTRALQRTGQEFAQAQRSRSQELAAEQRLAVQAQIQQARELVQKQRALTSELLAEQRARRRELLRAPVVQ